VRHWWRTRSHRVRIAEHLEFGFDTDLDKSCIEIKFFAPRRPIEIAVQIKETAPVAIDRYEYSADAKTFEGMNIGVTYKTIPEGVAAVVALVEQVPTKACRIHLRGKPGDGELSLSAAVVRDDEPDYDLLVDGFTQVNLGRTDLAIRLLSKYATMAPGNPNVYLALAMQYYEKKDYEQACAHAVRASANGLGQQGMTMYQKVQDDRPFAEIEPLRQLQSECRQWQVDGHHGALVLKEERYWRLGLDGWYIREFHSIMEVRRTLAARVIRRLDFSFTSQDVLLHTRARVVRADNTAETLARDKFSTSDSPMRNIFIESRADWLGTWMLPDLEIGDLIDWQFAIAHHERAPIDNDPHLFITSALHDFNFPTYRASVAFEAPTEWKLNLIGRNGMPEPKQIEPTDGNLQRYEFAAERFVPTRQIGSRFEALTLYPNVGCTVGDRIWSRTTPELMRNQVGDDICEGDLPGYLGELAAQSDAPLKSLEQAFYWARDKIKYGSFRVANARIGAPERLQAIIESGFGDCKDKTFMLRQLCHKLGLDSFYVLVSAENGVVYEELPADQFDHVFLGVKTGEDFLYLDAAGTENVFGLPPLGAQGLKGLSDCEGGRIITLPEDDPDANTIEISETFDRIEHNWLAGSFHVRALGRNGRVIDEVWKAVSLRQHDQAHTISVALSRNLPRIHPEEAVRTSQTGDSNCFAANGRHRRGQLSQLDKKLVGTLTWDEPSLPLQEWRYLHANRYMSFQMPVRLVFRCRLEGDAYRRLLDISRPPQFENHICRITSELTRRDDAVDYQCSIIIKKVFIPNDEQDQFPPAMEHVEEAMRMALIFTG
jgi:hypothetical protein